MMADWNAVQKGFLAHSASVPEHLANLLQAAPDFALGHAVKGLFCLLLGRRELVAEAENCLKRARDAAGQGGGSDREAQYIAALADCLGGAYAAAAQRMESILDRAPGDALAVKLGHAIRFVLGDAQGMRASVERVLPAYGPDHAAHGYILGCHAFALEETGDYEAAEVAGRRALWTAPDDAWGLHAVAHVHDMTGRARQGIDWLTGREAAWAHCNNFRYHVWWHKALMHLDQGEIDVVFDLYDREIRSDRTDDYRDISNAASLLARLELEGVHVGDRWEEMAEISAARSEDGCLIFADLHYLLALGGDGREADMSRLMQRIRRDADAGGGCAMARMAAPGLAAAEGLRAFTEGRYELAFDNLSRARPDMQLAGGSHAQRDVFERITIDAGLRAGQIDRAERILTDRQRRRGGAEDGFCAARRTLIEAARRAGPVQSVPAE